MAATDVLQPEAGTLRREGDTRGAGEASRRGDLGAWRQRLATPVAALESLALPALVVALGWWARPEDPLLTAAEFPWTWLAPAIIALRYGSLAGAAAAAVLLLAWFGWAQPEAAFPKGYFLGGLTLTMVCGELAGSLQRRVRRAEAEKLYHAERLQQLTHQYYLERLSHDRLEQDLITRPVAMRDAVQRLRRLVESAPGDAGSVPHAQQLLALLTQYCQLERAAIHAMRDGAPRSRPLATVGERFALDAGDPLVRFALQTRRLAHVQLEAARSAGSRYQAVAPLLGPDGAPFALLVVRAIPFFALHEETLLVLALLVSYYADSVAAPQPARDMVADAPQCPPGFALELHRVTQMQQRFGVDSTVVSLEFTHAPRLDDLLALLARRQRALDVSWRMDLAGRTVVLVLLPLTSGAAAESYVARVDEMVHETLGRRLGDPGLAAQVHSVAGAQPPQLLHRLLAACHVVDPDRARDGA